MTLRVALVSLYPAPGAKAPGGVRVVVQNLLQGLLAYDDLRIDVIHCHADIDQSMTVEKETACLHYLAMPRRRLVPNTLASISRVEQLLRQLQPDVVNAHAAHYAIAGLRAGCPTIYTIHGVIHREARVYQSRWFDRIRYSLEIALDRYAVGHVADIVAISPHVLEEYRHRSQASFHRIDNPVPGRFFEIANAEEEGRLLYPGTIDERKNVQGLLQALDLVRQQVPDVHLRIAGRTTNPGYYRRVQDFVAAQGLERNVTFLGLQASSEMMREYARCSAVVLASREETAPMAVIEAMAAGKPVVGTRVGGVADLVEDGGSGFVVDAGDMEALAQRMVLLVRDANLRHRMGERGRQLAQRFRVPVIADQYRQLYYQVAGKELP